MAWLDRIDKINEGIGKIVSFLVIVISDRTSFSNLIVVKEFYKAKINLLVYQYIIFFLILLRRYLNVYLLDAFL